MQPVTRTQPVRLTAPAPTPRAVKSESLGQRFLDVFEQPLKAIGHALLNHDDARFDGQLVGADGRTFPATTPLSQLPAAEPKSGTTDPTPIVYVNGMGIPKDRQAKELQRVADQTGSRVVGLHNATEGLLGDFTQAAGDKLDLGHNPAVESLTGLVLSELDQGHPVHLMAHSHGALITSRALSHVREALLSRGLSSDQVDAKLHAITVETFGGAASSYPDGPLYVHYVNTDDIQSAIYGMGEAGDPRRAHAGKGAVFVPFSSFDWNPMVTHDFPGTYLPHRKPVDEVEGEV